MKHPKKVWLWLLPLAAATSASAQDSCAEGRAAEAATDYRSMIFEAIREFLSAHGLPAHNA